jgi:beta-lactam-binding protein with PASTA domain
MKKLSVAAILLASLAVVLSGAALWRTRHISTKAPATAGLSTGSAAGLVDVPNEVLKNAYTAGADLTKIKLKFKVTEEPSVSTAKNKVMAQNPAPGTQVPVGTEVELTVSSGPT